MKKILLFLLRIYQRFISPLKPTQRVSIHHAVPNMPDRQLQNMVHARVVFWL